jgi:hypothetical protein
MMATHSMGTVARTNVKKNVGTHVQGEMHQTVIPARRIAEMACWPVTKFVTMATEEMVTDAVHNVRLRVNIYAQHLRVV